MLRCPRQAQRGPWSWRHLGAQQCRETGAQHALPYGGPLGWAGLPAIRCPDPGPHLPLISSFPGPLPAWGPSQARGPAPSSAASAPVGCAPQAEGWEAELEGTAAGLGRARQARVPGH